MAEVRNLGLAPRDKRCWICRRVAAPEDVTARLFDEQGNRRKTTEAVDYLYSLGLAGSRATMQKRALAHAKHLEAYAANPYPLAPVTTEGGNAQLVDVPHSGWMDVTQGAMDLGMEAQRQLHTRLPGMEDKDVVAVARLGAAAATRRADLERRGQWSSDDVLMALGAGYQVGRAASELDPDTEEIVDG